MVTLCHVTHLMGSGGGSPASLPAADTGGRGVEIERREAGSGVMLPEDRVKPPVSVSGIFSFFGLRVFLAAALLLIISRGAPPGLRGAAGREPGALGRNFLPGEAEPSSLSRFLAFIFLAAPS